MEYLQLDHPVANSIAQTHRDYGIDYNTARFYHPDYCSFGDFLSGENAATILEEYALLTPAFYVFGQLPNLPKSIGNKGELVCHQMIVSSRINYPITENIVKLGSEQLDDLLGLVRLVYPEYFKTKTASLGHYYGIYKNNQLVAITGERMQMDGFIEVSAVITHPDHHGKGYAKQLVTHTSNAIFDQNKIPFLHVAHSNKIAIGLYETLGYSTREKMSIWHLIQK
ncbi:MAG: GNAT family N-acetyltransferase [Flavobacterium sp.]